MTIPVAPSKFDRVSPSGDGAPPLRVAIVNNMPDAALAATERQFRHVIKHASGERPISVSVFVMPEIPRGEIGQRYCATHARPLKELLADSVDALVVTGCEPQARSLRDEPFWASFETLIEWAKNHTISVVWSCLAAHAAVLHLDGIERQRLPSKLSGVFFWRRSSDHPLLSGMSEIIAVPHSRYNGLGRDDLVRAGYDILTQSDIGVDSFTKRYDSLFVFLQGHPEYAGDTLGREYRRDVERFVAGRSEIFPAAPENYFDGAVAKRLAAFAAETSASRRIDAMSHFPLSVATLPAEGHWHRSSAQLYANWLSLIAADVAQRRPDAPRGEPRCRAD